jgi:predicted amidohydrolase
MWYDETGYPKFSTFGVSVGTRTLEGRQEFVQYYKNAISTEPGSPEISEIESIAKEFNIFIVTGFIEKDNGTLYCSVGFFSPIEGLLYKRRKVRLYARDNKSVRSVLICIAL